MQHFSKLFFTGILMLVFIPANLFSQVVISSNSSNPVEDGSAVLELQSPDMGLLIPKFAIDDLAIAAPVTNPAVGLLVYNTSLVTPEGFYFWDGTNWTEVINNKRIFANEQFGEMFEMSATTPTSISLSTANIFYGWTTASSGDLSTGITVDSLNATADRMNISRYGLYKIELCLSIGGTQNQQITSSVFVTDAATNTASETRIKAISKISSAGDLISGSSMGVLELFPGDALDLRFKTTNNGETLNIYTINLIVTKVGE